MDEEFLRQLAESTRELLGSRPDGLTVTSLQEFGWDDLLDENPQAAVASMFEEVGAAAATTAALDLIVRHAAPALAGYWPFTACRLTTVSESLLVPDTTVEIRGVLSGSGSVVPETVVAWHPSVHTIAVLDLRGTDPEMQDLGGVDPSKRLRTLRVAARVVSVADSATTTAVHYAIMRACAYEQLGAARTILAVAAEHVRERRQFDRPIGAYQAVQHRLADVFVAAEAATAALEASWLSQLDIAVPTAALLSAHTAAAAVTHGLQVCGGMGFTEEFSFSGQIRRAVLLADLYWSETELAQRIGERVRAGTTLPRLETTARMN